MDGYKPKEGDIVSTITATIVELNPPIIMNEYPSCGWLGICADTNCVYLDTTRVEESTYYYYHQDLLFVYYSVNGCQS